jgi:hypothetical protein
VDYPLWYWILSLVIAVVFGLWCGWYAEQKGYSRVLFTVLGFFFFIITAIVILLLPSKRRS